MAERTRAAAYGGAGWRPRERSALDEIGTIWSECGVSSEFETLRAVLLHRPGEELDAVTDANAALMLGAPDAARAAVQHDSIADAYRRAGIRVIGVEPPVLPPPNQMFVADLSFMTPAGAILARPASAARAGEERWVARRLAAEGIPIICSVTGRGTFEGADAMWIDRQTVLLGVGPRTNDEGAAQIAAALDAIGVTVARTRLPAQTMHLMGQLRLLDADLAIYWPDRIEAAALDIVRSRGYETRPLPDHVEAEAGHALNMVTLAPRRVILPAGNPRMESMLRELRVDATAVQLDEVHQAAGSIGCLTGVLHRA